MRSFASQAARKFVEVAPELGSSFDRVVSPEDIAVYGGLCALATFSREEMKRKVLDNTSFKHFLDLVPQVLIVNLPIETTGGKGRMERPVVKAVCKGRWERPAVYALGNGRRYRPSVMTDSVGRR